jgi:hypothetical protein
MGDEGQSHHLERASPARRRDQQEVPSGGSSRMPERYIVEYFSLSLSLSLLSSPLLGEFVVLYGYERCIVCIVNTYNTTTYIHNTLVELVCALTYICVTHC